MESPRACKAPAKAVQVRLLPRPPGDTAWKKRFAFLPTEVCGVRVWLRFYEERWISSEPDDPGVWRNVFERRYGGRTDRVVGYGGLV